MAAFSNSKSEQTVVRDRMPCLYIKILSITFSPPESAVIYECTSLFSLHLVLEISIKTTSFNIAHISFLFFIRNLIFTGNKINDNVFHNA